MQLVHDALQLQPCDPTFTEARDAILLADDMNNDGANFCEIWRAFGKRGLGVNANSGPHHNSSAVTEDFMIPDHCEMPRITSLTFTNNLSVTWSAYSGGVYRVLQNLSLSPQTWSNVSGMVTSDGPAASFLVTNPIPPQIYFRVYKEP